MIRINLLPVEKRKAERTPLPRFGLVVLDVAVLTVIVFYCVYVWFQIGQVEGQIATAEKEIERLRPAVKEYQDLTAQVGSLSGRAREITDTIDRKVEWWRAMDSVWEVIHNNPRVWISDVSVMDANSAMGAGKQFDPTYNEPTPFGLSMKCHSGGRDVTTMTKFRMDLKRNTEVKKFFRGINWDAQWTLQTEPEYVEQYSMNFDIRLLGRPSLPPAPTAPGAPAGGPAR